MMAINFPDAPTTNQIFMGYIWDGEKWATQALTPPVGAVRYDTVQGLSAAEQSQARANIDVAKKNYIINGAMMVSQENGNVSGTALPYHPVDMFKIFGALSAGMALTCTQIAVLTPAGSPNRIRVLVTGAGTPSAGHVVVIMHALEGLRIADLKSGTASAKTITIKFGVRAPAGTYCISLQNAAGTRAYVAEYTVTAGEAAIDVVKSVTLTLCTTGTWAVDNTGGIYLAFTLSASADVQIAANTWTTITSSKYSTSNQFNLFGTIGNNFELFDVSLTEGTVAPPFVLPDVASELVLCERYYQLLSSVAFYTVSANFDYPTYVWPTTMRSAPTITPLPDGALTGMTFQGGVNSCFMLAPGPSQTVSGGRFKLDARI